MTAAGPRPAPSRQAALQDEVGADDVSRITENVLHRMRA
jgi:hypothetical protein